jgi:hypothetical protein
MSTDKEKLSEIAAKIEELTIKLAKATEELKSVSASMKILGGGQPAQTAPAAPATQVPPAQVPGTKLRTLDDIRMSFPEELESLLGFEDKGDYIIIKLMGFLGSEKFAKIASAVRGMGGEYISAGKESHFRVPKKKA